MACTCGVVLHDAVAKAAISTTPTARNPNGTTVPGALVRGRSEGLRTVLLINDHLARQAGEDQSPPDGGLVDHPRRRAIGLTPAGPRCTYLD